MQNRPTSPNGRRRTPGSGESLVSAEPDAKQMRINSPRLKALAVDQFGLAALGRLRLTSARIGSRYSETARLLDGVCIWLHSNTRRATAFAFECASSTKTSLYWVYAG